MTKKEVAIQWGVLWEEQNPELDSNKPSHM